MADTNKTNFLSRSFNRLMGTEQRSNNNNGGMLTKTISFQSSGFWGNTSVTEDTIVTIPAVKSALDIITQTVSTLPIVLYKFDKDNAPQEIKGDARVSLLNGDTNDYLTGATFKQKITKDLVLYGQSVVMMNRNKSNANDIDSLYPLDTKDLQVDIYTNNGYQYSPKYTYNSAQGVYPLNTDDAINITKDSDDGITGEGVIQKGASVLRLALTQYQYEMNLLNNGAMPSGVLQFPTKITKNVFQRLKENFSNTYSGYDKAGKVVVLEEGGEYKPLQFDPDKLQLNVSKADMLGQVARLFNLPETLINAKANKYNSNEQNDIQFFQFCLKPILNAIISSFNKYLLKEKEKQEGYYFDFNTDSIFLNTLEEKAKAYTNLFNNSLLTYNEARNKLGLHNTTAGKDFTKFSLGTVVVDSDGDISVFNTMDTGNGGNQDANLKDAESNPSDKLSQPDTGNQPSDKPNEQSAKSKKQTTK